MVGIFDFFTKREKTVKHKTIETEISNLCEKLMDGIIDLSETANKMKKLKEQLKEVPDDDGDGDSNNDGDKNSSTKSKQDNNENSVLPQASPIAASPSESPTPVSPATNNEDKGFLANFNIFGNKKTEPVAEKKNPEPEPAAEKKNPEPEPAPEKKQEVSSVSSESPLPRPDAVIPNKDLAAVAAPQASDNTVSYTEYLANGGPNAEYEKNIRGGKDKKKHKKTKHAKRSSSGKRTKKQKHITVSKEEQTQEQAQA
jgi:hypothetical protein